VKSGISAVTALVKSTSRKATAEKLSVKIEE
jgi:hypothetical protein